MFFDSFDFIPAFNIGASLKFAFVLLTYLASGYCNYSVHQVKKANYHDLLLLHYIQLNVEYVNHKIGKYGRCNNVAHLLYRLIV